MMWFSIYIAIAILSGLIFCTLFMTFSKQDNPYYNSWGLAQDTMMGLVAGAIWPLALLFFGAGWISDWASDWIQKKSEEEC